MTLSNYEVELQSILLNLLNILPVESQFTSGFVDRFLTFFCKEQQEGWVALPGLVEVEAERLRSNKALGGGAGHGYLRACVPLPETWPEDDEKRAVAMKRWLVRQFRGYVITRVDFEADKTLRGCVADNRSIWHKLAPTWEA